MKQKLLLCGAAVFAVLFLFSAIMLQRQFSDQKQSAEAFDHIAGIVVEETEPDAAEQPEEPGETEVPPALTAYEKYAAVYEQNPDFVGWISIDGTNINYPVMQTPGNPDFYLKHAFDKSYSDYGVPYVQENCDLEQSDNVVIYRGHTVFLCPEADSAILLPIPAAYSLQLKTPHPAKGRKPKEAVRHSRNRIQTLRAFLNKAGILPPQNKENT